MLKVTGPACGKKDGHSELSITSSLRRKTHPFPLPLTLTQDNGIGSRSILHVNMFEGELGPQAGV